MLVHEEFIPIEVPAVQGNREEGGNEEVDTSPGSSGVQLNSSDLLADVEFALDVQKRNRVIAQANLNFSA